ncbi:hypothetical protein D3C86_2074440 [compost metagenome]
MQASMARSERPRVFLLYSLWKRLRKCSTSSGISSRRSRRGGMLTGNTLSR